MGIIKTLIGTATATAIDGSQRTLQAGDRVFQDEVITTGPAGAVEVELVDGSIMTLGRSSQTLLTDEIFAQTGTPTSTATDNDVESLQQALLDGTDPTQVADATAAGAGAGAGAETGNEGIDIVQVDHLAPEVTPENGFDTTGINIAFDEPEEEDELPLGLNPPVDFDVSVTAEFVKELPFKFAPSSDDSESSSSLIFLPYGGYLYEFQAGEAEDISDNIHGTDVEDGVTSDFTITSLPTNSEGEQVGLLFIDRNDDGTIDEVYGDGNVLPAGGLSIVSGDSVYYFQSASFSNEQPSLISVQDFDFPQPSLPQPVSFNYFTTDSDGLVSDGAVVSVGFSEVDDNPEAGNTSVIVDEDGLKDGIPGGEDDAFGEASQVSGNLNYDFGGDGAGDVDFASLHTQTVQANGDAGLQDLTSQGNAVSYVWNAATHTLSGVANAGAEDQYDVFSLEVTDINSGQYIFTLLAAVDHPTAGTEDNLVLNLPFTVSDFDGDTAPGSLEVTIDDDTPQVSPTEYQLTITNHRDVNDAGFTSSYGYYIKDVSGDPTSGLIIWANVNAEDGDTLIVSGYSPEQIGFFMIPDGNNLNDVTNNIPVTFAKNLDGEWQAFSGEIPLLGDSSPVLFDNPALNLNNEEHVEDNAIIGNQNWEDTVDGTHPWADNDFNDVNINVEWAVNDAEIAYGADGGPLFAGEILVSDDDGAITAGGEAIQFTLKDINSDGKLDLVGSIGGDDFGSVILTVDDILSDDEPSVEFSGLIDQPNGNVTVDVNGAFTDGDGDPAVQFNVNVEILVAQPDFGAEL